MILGTEKLAQDLRENYYPKAEVVHDTQNQPYVLIPGFSIPAGSFAGRTIDLAIPVPADYPRSLGASIHIRATPHLAAFGQGISSRNVLPSKLGEAWQYWSFRFRPCLTNPTAELLSQINAVFRHN